MTTIAITTPRPLRVIAALAALALAGGLAPRTGQAQTITACSAQTSGTMYRVGVNGAPATCTSDTHRKETWNVQGPAGLSAYKIVEDTTAVPANSWVSFAAWCPVGSVAIGGGMRSDGSPGQLQFDMSFPNQPSSKFTGGSWSIRARNTTSTPRNARAYAVCAKVAS